MYPGSGLVMASSGAVSVITVIQSVSDGRCDGRGRGVMMVGGGGWVLSSVTTMIPLTGGDTLFTSSITFSMVSAMLPTVL